MHQSFCTAEDGHAHTCDTVIVGVGAPVLAINVPGYGDSPWHADGYHSHRNSTVILAPVLRDTHIECRTCYEHVAGQVDCHKVGYSAARSGE
ncbi:hypothetical protein [Mycobacterium lepromatosis]|uniref:hypothetical protein n=1 Tax=Mycobacterium lepromatosis TaxID=480418 RepID=UPI000679807C|nr:hypothetical protein [Mycobacterium lepromatosis]